MMINKNRIIKLAVIVMSAVVLVAMSPLFAEANNHADTEWSFTVGSYGNDGLIVKTGREKTDATSVYIKCTNYNENIGSKGNSFTATAYGSNSATSGFFNCTYNGKSSKSYNLSYGSEYKMINYIYEAGYGYANIRYNAAYCANLMFGGVWSPDSI